MTTKMRRDDHAAAAAEDEEKRMYREVQLDSTPEIEVFYRVTHLLANLGWVDFDLRSSPGLLGQ